jgi:multiple sugar transport system permease protein
MAVTTLKPNEELYNFKEHNPFWVTSPTLANINRLLFETDYPRWLMTTMTVAVVSTALSLFASVLAAYAIGRLRFKGSSWVGLAIYLAYLVPPSILFIPLATMVFRFGLFDSPVALILTYPLEECARIDGASRLQILWKITLPLAVPGLISAGIFAFTLSWNEFIYALAFIQSAEKKTVPVAVLTQLVEGDVYHWGSLMAGALLGSIPVALIYSFFVEYYVSSLTGAVKE